VRSIVMQAWLAAQGERRDLVVGVVRPGPELEAHAWLEGEEPHGEHRFQELIRRPGPTLRPSGGAIAIGPGRRYVAPVTTGTGSALSILRAAALAALVLGVFLLLGSWDGLYEELDLPQGIPALPSQMGGAALIALAYLLWASASRPELAPTAAATGLIAEGGGAIIIAAWLLFRDRDDLGIDTLGTVLLIVVAVLLGLLALGLAKVALDARGRPG
jgi:Transglutaminase-like superfamily